MKVWTEISSKRLTENFATLRRTAANSNDAAAAKTQTALLAVTKANAYGHGIDPCAAILAEAGAEWLGVTDATEGVEVRRVLAEAGIDEAQQPKVLAMCGTAGLEGEAQRMVRHRLTPVVWSTTHLERLVGAAREADLQRPFPVHVEIDSGMTRQGVLTGRELESLLSAIGCEPRLKLGGVLTHFASTDVSHSPQTSAQQASFEVAIEQVAASGLKPEWVHVGNSSYIDSARWEDDSWRRLHTVAQRLGARAMVRSGIALYGYLLPVVSADEAEVRSLDRPRLLPVMTWKTRVIAVSDVPAGALVGYNGTFLARVSMRLALLPVGYADGLRRELSCSNERAGGWVMIRGQRAPIIGRVSMNLTTVDVSAIEGVGEGDEAVLLGDGVTAEDHARLAGTIAYEILCGVRGGPGSIVRR